MSPQCLPPSFSLIRLTVREQISFQDFQAGKHGGHLGYWNGTNLAILNLHATPMPPTKFGLNPTYGSGADWVWRFSRWPPLRKDFRNSESLCSSYASHCFSSIWLNSLGGDVWRYSRWPTWQPSCISEGNDFSNSKSPCGPNASHQV